MSLFAHVLAAMREATADDGSPLFEDANLAKLLNRCIEGCCWLAIVCVCSAKCCVGECNVANSFLTRSEHIERQVVSI